MSLAGFASARRRSILAFLIIGVIAGVISAVGLPVSLFPNVPFPRIQVNLDAGDRPEDQTEILVTRPLEQALQSVPGVVNLRSTTSRGSAEVRVAFRWNTDMNLALQRVEAALAQTAPTLPPGAGFTVRRMDPTVFPVAAFNLTSEKVGPATLRRWAQFSLAPILTRTSGVARVDTMGGAQPEYRVEVDPDRLRAHGLALTDVAAALAQANIIEAGGRLEDRGRQYLTLTDGRLTGPGDIAKVVIKSAGGGMVRVGDIATTRLSPAPNFIRVTGDGRDAVSVQIYQQPSGDTVRIVSDIRQQIDRLAPQGPSGLKVSTWYDQGELIVGSARTLVEAIAVGALLAGLVLLAFLRNPRITLAAVIAVPVVLALTTLTLAGLGQSFNIMTLGGMAAAIGLVIDDIIVMIEHLERRAADQPATPLEAMRAGAAEFFKPLAGSSAATVLIFAPLAFMTGVTGAFFRALSLTMALALTLSFLVAWLVGPMMAEALLTRGAGVTRSPSMDPLSRWGRAFATAYELLLAEVIARPLRPLAILVPMSLAGAVAFAVLPSGFMPKMDEGGFILDYIAQPGLSLSETDRLMRHVEDVLRATPEVVTYSRRTGAQLGGGITESNTGDFFVRLKPQPRRDIEAVMRDVRKAVQSTTPGVDFETAQLMEDLIGDLTSTPQPIEVKLFGADPATLHAAAKAVAEKIAAIKGVTEIKDGVIIAGDAIDVRVDPTRAALEGLTTAEVSRQVSALMSGAVATSLVDQGLPMDIRVWISSGRRARLSDVATLPIKTGDGRVVDLSHVADIDQITGQAEVDREGGRRMDAVTARVEGRDMGSAAHEVAALLSRPGALPAGVTFEMGGLYAEQQAAFRGLALVFFAALGVITVLLLVLYERWRIVLAILPMPLAAATAVGGGLWLAGVELNIMALMGVTMVVGIVTEVAIFFFTEFEDRQSQGLDVDAALLAAGKSRLRPIAMTTLAAIFALAPLALGHSMQQPLAVAIIAGLSVQGPLVLLAMPALYRWLSAIGPKASLQATG